MSDIALLEAALIRGNRCPVCGQDLKDKGTYIRCTSCAFSTADSPIAIVNQEQGYIVLVQGYGNVPDSIRLIGEE